MKTSTIILAILLLLFASCQKEAAQEASPPQAEAKPRTVIPEEEPLDTCVVHAVAGCVTDRKKPNIRVRNVSKYDYCNLTVTACCGDGEVNHGDLPAGSVTCYRAYADAYPAVNIDFSVHGHPFSLHVIDHVGDTLVPPGNYTLEVGIYNYAKRYASEDLKVDR